MEEKRCYGCMAPSVGAAFCPHCGYPTGKENEPHQLRTGTVLQEKYLIGKVLGQGGFGITYLGWDLSTEEIIAVKEYYPATQVTRDTSRSDHIHCYTGTISQAYLASKERFLREARTLARLENIPSVVRIRDCFELNETAYIVMEYVKGSNLYSYISMRGGRIGFTETMNILAPIMDALTAVHSMGLIHRDLSPDNIMLHPTRGAILLDFGAVRDVTGANVDTPLAKSTEAILKHGFAPTEQYRTRGSLGPWTDVYALCATIYYCLTGCVPPEAVALLLGEERIDWASVPGLNDAQRGVLAKGMAPTASQRYMSVEALFQDLTAATFPAPAPVPPEIPKVTAKSPKNTKGKRLPLILGISGALIALSVFIRMVLPGPEPPARQPEVEMSDSVYTNADQGTSTPGLSIPTEDPYLTIPSEEPADAPETVPEETEPAEVLNPEDITAPKAEGAVDMTFTQSVYYSYSHDIATLGVDCTWNYDPITIAFSEQLDFSEANTEVFIANYKGERLTNPGFRFTWDNNMVYVKLPQSLAPGVYHINIRKDNNYLDYVLCAGEDGQYYPIDLPGNTYGAGLQHEASRLFLVRGEDGFSMIADTEKKSSFDDASDICGVEYRSGIPYPSVTGEPAQLVVTEYFKFDHGSFYLIQLDNWYLAYNSQLGLHFTKELTADCHWNLAWW